MRIDRETWKAKYVQYMRSRAWAIKRKKVIRRANGTCERCFKAGANSVHHLNYSRLGHEKLRDLVALCARCHGELHNKAPIGEQRDVRLTVAERERAERQRRSSPHFDGTGNPRGYRPRSLRTPKPAAQPWVSPIVATPGKRRRVQEGGSSGV